jgi:hypothetical protein
MANNICILVAILLSPAWAIGQGTQSPVNPGLPGSSKTEVVEQLKTFDPKQAQVQWADNRWFLRSGQVWIKDFGRRESEAREALRVIQTLHLTQLGTVGTPRSVMEYWLNNGRAPQGSSLAFRTTSFDPSTLRIEQAQGQYYLRDGSRILFAFGPHADDANKALGIIRLHEFNRIGYVGQPMPAMIYFLAEPTLKPHWAVSSFNRTSKDSSSDLKHHPISESFRKQVASNAPSSLPMGRQLNPPSTTLTAGPELGEHVPLVWYEVQVRREGQDWKLVAGDYPLGNFGSDERGARQALDVVKYYRFTEHDFLGGPVPSFSYFLVNGQAPRGLRFGVDKVRFDPKWLSLQRDGNDFTIASGGNVLFHFGDKEAEAKQALQTMQKYGFDHVCHVGSPGQPGLTFLVRAR